MFGLSFGEILVILVIALIVLGPERLPGFARTVGKTMADLRRTLDEMKLDLSLHDVPERETPARTAGKLVASSADGDHIQSGGTDAVSADADTSTKPVETDDTHGAS